MKKGNLVLVVFMICVFISCKNEEKKLVVPHEKINVEKTPENQTNTTVFTDFDGQKLEVTFDSSKHTASFNFNDEEVKLDQQQSGSGFVYANETYLLQGKGNDVELLKNGKTVFTMLIPFEEAKNYFVKNNYPDQELHFLKLTSENEFNKIFGMATFMGEAGKPTKIDFSECYIIALIGKTNNNATDLEVKSLKKDYNTIVITVFSKSKKAKVSYTSRPVKLLIVKHKYKGDIKLESF